MGTTAEINDSECQAVVSGTRYGPPDALIGLAGRAVRDDVDGWLTIQSIGERYVRLQSSVQETSLKNREAQQSFSFTDMLSPCHGWLGSIRGWAICLPDKAAGME